MSPSNLSKATLGGGCFWCIEAVFDRVEGVRSAVNGYAGGDAKDPSYEEVSRGSTSHAEVVQVTFDPERISYRELLEIFFTVHDPTTKDRQGADVGRQYRSIILTHDDHQAWVAEEVMEALDAERGTSEDREARRGRGEDEGIWDGIVTEVKPLEDFYEAEKYHQDYFKKHPERAYCRTVIQPKLQKLRKRWSGKLRPGA